MAEDDQEGNKFASYPSLADRVVVLTGGAQGIGASMVEQFALQGSRVVFLDIDDELANGLVARVTALEGVRHRPVYHRCDVINVDGELRPTAGRILADYPKVDVLINNAARAFVKPTSDITTEEWDDSINVNLRHQFFLTQALTPGLLAAGGHASVINMGSISWALPATGIVPYTTSKAAVVGLTRTLAHELGPRGVRVNSIMPGSIATERELKHVMTPEYEQKVLGGQALKRLIKPVEVARLAMWLASDDSAMITNQSIRIDAGWT